MMSEAQEEDVDISKTIGYVQSGKKTNTFSDTENLIESCVQVSLAVW